MPPQRSDILLPGGPLGEFMQEIAIAFVVVALLAFAGIAVAVQSSLSCWRSDES